MAITIKDIMKLEAMQSFELVAGEKGINRIVTSANVLDYEFTPDVKIFGNELFDKNSFVISSLLFAKYDRDRLYDAIKFLMDTGVSGFAFKTVIFDEVPEEILMLAEEHDFPIYKYGGDAFSENVIFSIMEAVRDDGNLHSTEQMISRMISENLSRSEVAVLSRNISSSFRQNARSTYLSNFAEADDFSLERIIKSFHANKEFRQKAAVCRFRNGLMVIITMDLWDDRKCEVIFSEALMHLGIDTQKESLLISHSNVHHSYEGLDYCFRECFYASIAGMVLKKQMISYHQIGTYQFLIPQINNEEITSFMYRYLAPVIKDEEQLRTAVQFVLAEGNIDQTSEKLVCHKNTVRYRINKLHKLLDPKATYENFYENMATAIKIYLLKHLTHRYHKS